MIVSLIHDETGRSSDLRTWILRSAYLPPLPSRSGPVLVRAFRFRFTATGQFRIYTGFPFKPDRQSHLDGHRWMQDIGRSGRGQPNKLWTSCGISGLALCVAGFCKMPEIVSDVPCITTRWWGMEMRD
jgi:hypothetical protein